MWIIMNKDNVALESESCPGFTGSTDVIKHVQESKRHCGSKRGDDLDVCLKLATKMPEEEPLFVVDRTNSFKLNHKIEFKSSTSNTNNKAKNSGLSQNACWNCSSTDHSLYNCPEPRNHRIINQNRHIFLMQKEQYSGSKNFRNRSGNPKNVRYFVRRSNFPITNYIPGKMSNELLEAMGLPENGIPPHVYNMREYGYPGGWLEEARKEYSGISIFTAPNECLPLPGKENGEDDIFCWDIDEKKLHEYPGFNAPCPPDAVDEFKKYGCPEFNPDQSLKNMIEQLKCNKKLTGDTCFSEDTGFASISNETLTEEDSLQCKIVDEEKLPSSPEDGEITEDDEDNITEDESGLNEHSVKSPSNDVVQEKSVNEQCNSDTLESCVDTKESANDTQISISNSVISESQSSSVTPSSSKRKFGDIKSEILGTPVLKRFSTFENRPTHENFAKGMVDMIDHENLPNSVGTFQKLKEILKDVRQTLNNLL